MRSSTPPRPPTSRSRCRRRRGDASTSSAISIARPGRPAFIANVADSASTVVRAAADVHPVAGGLQKRRRPLRLRQHPELVGGARQQPTPSARCPTGRPGRRPRAPRRPPGRGPATPAPGPTSAVHPGRGRVRAPPRRAARSAADRRAAARPPRRPPPRKPAAGCRCRAPAPPAATGRRHRAGARRTAGRTARCAVACRLLLRHLRASRVDVQRMGRPHDVAVDGDGVGRPRPPAPHRLPPTRTGRPIAIGSVTARYSSTARTSAGSAATNSRTDASSCLRSSAAGSSSTRGNTLSSCSARDRIRRALVWVDGDDQPHRPADRQLVHQRRRQVVEQVCVVDDQQQPVGHRLASRPQHRGGLTVVGDVDQVAYRRERHDAIGHRSRHPGRRVAETLAGGPGNRRLARADPRDDHRPAAVPNRRLDVSGCRLGRHGLPVDGHPPEFRVWPRRPCRTRLRLARGCARVHRFRPRMGGLRLLRIGSAASRTARPGRPGRRRDRRPRMGAGVRRRQRVGDGRVGLRSACARRPHRRGDPESARAPRVGRRRRRRTRRHRDACGNASR